MKEQEALTLVESLLHAANPKQKLNDLQSTIFLSTWKELTYKEIYEEIVEQLGYKRDYDYIKQVGSQLWRTLSPFLGEPVTKGNLQAVLRRYQQKNCSLPASGRAGEGYFIQSKQDWGEVLDIGKLLSVLINAEVTEEILPKEPLRQLLEALGSLKERSLISK